MLTTVGDPEATEFAPIADPNGTGIARVRSAMSTALRHLDVGSRVVILVSCVLFIAALFAKGLGHGVLLEAAVFLVSVKLIIMAYKSSTAATELKDHLLHLHADLLRIESLLEERRPKNETPI